MRSRLFTANPPRRPKLAAQSCAPLLWLLTMLFAVRVAGQAIQRWWPQPFLPPFHKFQGSHFDYPVLLTAQLLILSAMFRGSWKAQRGTLSASRRAASALLWLGGLYMAASLARLAIGLAFPAAPAWFSAWISGVFHLVLAGYVLTLAAFHRRAFGAREFGDVAQ
jgi:fatty acid desaturase